jgi:hypothetical protein
MSENLYFVTMECKYNQNKNTLNETTQKTPFDDKKKSTKS